MAIQATGRATFTAVEDYDIVFVLNGVGCDTLNFDSVRSAESAVLEADFTNGGAPCVVDRAVLACYDGEGTLMGSSIEVHDSSSAVADGGNLYLSKDCRTISCEIYQGEKRLCARSITVVRNGSGVSVKAVAYKVLNNVDAGAALNWDSVQSQANYPTQKPDKGKYCYVMTIVLYTDGTTTNSVSTSYTPMDGNNGTSVTIKETKVEYAGGDNGTTVPASGWNTSVPQLGQGKFLWTRTTVVFSDGKSTVSYSVGRIGMDGAKGGTTHILYASSANPQSAADVRTTIDAMHQYYGTYQDTALDDDVNKYTSVTSWVLIKGKDGKSARRTAVVSVTSEDGTVFNDKYENVILKCKVMIDGKSMGGVIPSGNFTWTKDGEVTSEANGIRFRTASSSDSLDLWKCSVKIPKRLLEPIELTTVRVEGNNLIFRASEDITGKTLYPAWRARERNCVANTPSATLYASRTKWRFFDGIHDHDRRKPNALSFNSLGNNMYSVDLTTVLTFVQSEDIMLHHKRKKTVLKHGKHTYLVKKGDDGKYRAWGRYGVILADSNFTPISTPAKCKIYIETDSDTETTGTAKLSV